MPTYENPWQWNRQAVEWDLNAPKQSPWDVTFEQVNPGYISGMMQLRSRVQSGQADAQERATYQQMEAAARAIPMRDPASLEFGWNTDEVGSWTQGGSDWWKMINGSSPDLGPVMLSIADRLEQGKATEHERQLFKDMMEYDTDWNWRASVPQESDAFNPLGDQFFGALATLAAGATGGLAAAPLAAGGAGLTSTLSSIGTLAGVAGTAASAVGQEMDEEWLKKLGLALSATGGITGAAGGLANVASTGINSLSDAARLAGNAGQVVSGVGAVSDNDLLRQIGGYLSAGGQAGSGIDSLATLASGGVKDLTDVGRLLKSVGQVTGAAGRVTGNRELQQAARLLGLGKNVQGLLGAATQAQQRGRRDLTDDDWLRRDWRRVDTPSSTLANL